MTRNCHDGNGSCGQCSNPGCGPNWPTAARMFDPGVDHACGYMDGTLGHPRASTRPWYRKGYDKGFTERCNRRA